MRGRGYIELTQGSATPPPPPRTPSASASMSRDARKAHEALDRAIVALDDLVVRLDTGRISLHGVRKELARVLGGPLAAARLHGAFAAQEAGLGRPLPTAARGRRMRPGTATAEGEHGRSV